MDHSIKQLATLLGVVPSSIRKYEEKGIIKPRRNEDNLYRQYGLHDVGTLVRIRQLRQAGFSLSQVDEMLNSFDVGDVRQQLRARQRELNEEIEERRRLLSVLDDWQANLNSIDAGIVSAVSPALCFRKYMNRNGLVQSREAVRLAARWLEDMPHSFPCIVIPREDVFQGEPDYGYSVGVAMPEARARQRKDFGAEKTLPASPCLAVTVPILTDICDAMFSDLLCVMVDRKLVLTGDPWGEIMFTMHHADPSRYLCYTRFYFPVA